MPLSKARNAARMRIARAEAKGMQPSASQKLEIMSTNQRKDRLAELILMPLDSDKITAKHVISAIDVYNKMDKLYNDNGGAQVQVNVQFVIGRGYRQAEPQQVIETTTEGEDLIGNS